MLSVDGSVGEIRVNPWLNALFLAFSDGRHQLLLLMQQILAFRVSFVDLGRAFDKLRPALFRWNSPCEIESAIILN
jgi:hypothetical protein